MSTLNDVKYSALSSLTGQTGSLRDLEYIWLLSATGETYGQINDLWFLYFESLGYATGTLGDKWFEYLVDLGYSGSLNDMLYEFWLAGGPATGPAGYLLLETGVDKLILEDGSGFLLLEG